jgi:hypothetical protein
MRIEQDVITQVHFGLHVKYPLFSWILIKLEFSRQILKNPQTSNFMKTRPVGAGLFHADGRTDRHDEANIIFSQFCETHQKNGWEYTSTFPYVLTAWCFIKQRKDIAYFDSGHFLCDNTQKNGLQRCIWKSHAP